MVEFMSKRRGRKKACKKCKFLVLEGNVCPQCGSTSLSSKWDGYVYVLDASSKIAEMLKIKESGLYVTIIK
jgi:RNA polymerase subunit RPABC4/transcription elongation factor Spt4